MPKCCHLSRCCFEFSGCIKNYKYIFNDDKEKQKPKDLAFLQQRNAQKRPGRPSHSNREQVSSHSLIFTILLLFFFSLSFFTLQTRKLSIAAPSSADRPIFQADLGQYSLLATICYRGRSPVGVVAPAGCSLSCISGW